ncbi:MAG TPA: DUF309 domain-containing protein [Bacteroidota bacterium]
MPRKLIAKKKASDIRREELKEPTLDSSEGSLFEEGIRLFNTGRFWEAHEVWEDVWKNREEESRIFFQGIIQAAAGYHLIAERPRPGGAKKNLAKALEKLALFPDQFLGIEVGLLRNSIQETLALLDSQRGENSEKVKCPRVVKRER